MYTWMWNSPKCLCKLRYIPTWYPIVKFDSSILKKTERLVMHPRFEDISTFLAQYFEQFLTSKHSSNSVNCKSKKKKKRSLAVWPWLFVKPQGQEMNESLNEWTSFFKCSYIYIIYTSDNHSIDLTRMMFRWKHSHNFSLLKSSPPRLLAPRKNWVPTRPIRYWTEVHSTCKWTLLSSFIGFFIRKYQKNIPFYKPLVVALQRMKENPFTFTVSLSVWVSILASSAIV